MEKTIDFTKNLDSFEKNKSIETICLFGNPDIINNPILTICIPTYKRPDLLKRAIDSVLAQNTNLPFLLYVVDNEDDFSETETLKLIKSYSDNRLVYFKNKNNLGMGGNWNRCGEIVKTEYFAILHDDDVLLPSYINTIHNYIEKNKYDFIFVAYKQIDNPFINSQYDNTNKKNKLKSKIKDLLYKKTTLIKISDNLFLDNIFGAPTCGVLIKKSSFLSSGGFNMEYYPALDWFYFIYALKNFKCIKLNINCGIYYWEQNASLKEEVLVGFKNQRAIIINSLIKSNLSCRLFYCLLKKDFINKKKTRLEVPFNNSSFLYKLIFRLKVLKYRIED